MKPPTKKTTNPKTKTIDASVATEGDKLRALGQRLDVIAAAVHGVNAVLRRDSWEERALVGVEAMIEEAVRELSAMAEREAA